MVFPPYLRSWDNSILLASKFGNMIKADIVAAKPFIKILKCFRIINTDNRAAYTI